MPVLNTPPSLKLSKKDRSKRTTAPNRQLKISFIKNHVLKQLNMTTEVCVSNMDDRILCVTVLCVVLSAVSFSTTKRGDSVKNIGML